MSSNRTGWRCLQAAMCLHVETLLIHIPTIAVAAWQLVRYDDGHGLALSLGQIYPYPTRGIVALQLLCYNDCNDLPLFSCTMTAMSSLCSLRAKKYTVGHLLKCISRN